jgi:dihydrolipoamide dehydrogenase
LNASHKYEDAVKHFKDYGVIVSDVKVDWKVMMGQKDKAVAGLTQGVAGLLKKNKVDYL